MDKNSNRELLRGTLHEGLYTLNVQPHSSQYVKQSKPVPASALNKHPANFNCTTTSNVVFDKSNTTSVWHCRLGHPSKPIMNKVLSIVSPHSHCNTLPFCDACQLGKLHQFSFKNTSNNTTSAFELIHSDV